MTSLLMIGCGNMGGALLKGWMASELADSFSRVDVVKPTPPAEDIALDGVTFHTELAAIEHTPAIVVLAVKPHQLSEILPQAVKQFGLEPVYVSIAAGKTLENLQTMAGADQLKCIWAMPNTPVAVNTGIVAMCATDEVSEEEQIAVQELFASVGIVVWSEPEQMNALTALCGSGPAYVFYFMQCLQQAAAELGLDEDLADLLTRQMLLGASELASASEESLEQLRTNVTSPGGTTEAALKVWMEDETMQSIANGALQAAVKRAGELKG